MTGTAGGAPEDGGARERALLDELEDLRGEQRADRRRWVRRGLVLAVVVSGAAALLTATIAAETRGTADHAVWWWAALFAVPCAVAGRAVAVVVDHLADQRAVRVAGERRLRDRAFGGLAPGDLPVGDPSSVADDDRRGRLERELLDDLDDARDAWRGIRGQAAGFSAAHLVGIAVVVTAPFGDRVWTPVRAGAFTAALGAIVLGLSGIAAGVLTRYVSARANLVRAERRHREQALRDVDRDALPADPVRPVPPVGWWPSVWSVVPLAAVLAGVLVPAPPAPPVRSGAAVVVPEVPTPTGEALTDVRLDHAAGVAVSPDGRRVYVANRGSPDRPGAAVTVIDPDAGQAVGTLPVGSGPFRLALSPDGRRLYATDRGTAGAPGRTLSVVDTATARRTAVSLPASPSDVAVGPGGEVWVTGVAQDGRGPGALSLVDPATATVTATVAVGGGAYRLAVAPDGARVYVANYADNTVSVVDTATRRVTATVPVGAGPLGLVVDPYRRTLWVTALRAPDPRRGLTAVDTDTLTASAVDLGPVADQVEGAQAVALTPDGTRLLVGRSVTTGDTLPSVVVLDPQLRAVVGVVRTSGAWDLVAAPDGQQAYATSAELWRLPVL